MTTKYTDPIHTHTVSFLDISANTLRGIVDILQCQMMDSENIIYMIDEESLKVYLEEHTDPCYVTTYNTYDFQMVSTIDSSSVELFQIEKCSKLMGCITSRPIHMYLLCNGTVIKHKAYVMDHICAHRSQSSKNLGYYLIQNHEYNQRLRTPDVKISLLKKEGGLCNGVVPLVLYTTHTFCLYPIKLPKLKHGFVCVKIHNQNIDSLSDFMFSLSRDSPNNNRPLCCVVQDLAAIQSLIQQNIYFAYALEYKGKLFAIYIFKDTYIQYEEISEGRTLECVACFTNFYHMSYWDDIFFAGFLSALYDTQTNAKGKFGALRLHDLGHCNKILEHWLWKYKPLFQNPCAYYLYNAVIPNMPLKQSDCFIVS
jgi:hypothetical protein